MKLSRQGRLVKDAAEAIFEDEQIWLEWDDAPRKVLIEGVWCNLEQLNALRARVGAREIEVQGVAGGIQILIYFEAEDGQGS